MADHRRRPVPPNDPARAAHEPRPPLNPRSPRQVIAPERMPPPPSRRARHPLVIIGNAILTAFVLVILAAGVAFYVGKAAFEAPGPLDRERSVVIPRNTGIREIAEILRREGVIDTTLLFVGGAVAMRATTDLKAGEYLFEPGVSTRSVIETIIEGRSLLHHVTIPEGLTSEQIVQRLLEIDVLDGEVNEIPPEGTLLPESYKVARGTTREQLLRRMAFAHSRLVQEIWERRAPDLPLKTPEELVTLASIVEKETGRADERTRVAAVFINRLNRSMRLQSDPTVIYGLVGGEGSLGRPLTREDIERHTPYNTYVIQGLPPGPIANPGRASLQAVANPSRTRELYFVADGSGGHVFAVTYEQHLKNVARWRAYQKEQATLPVEPESADSTGDAGNAVPADSALPASAPAAESKSQNAPAAKNGATPAKNSRPADPSPKRAGENQKGTRTQ